MDTFDIFLYLAYTLVIVAAIAAIVLPLINALSDPKSLLMSGLGVLALVVVFIVGYAISGNEVTAVYTKFEVGPDLSKAVGGALIMTYILGIGAVLGIIYTEFIKIVK